MRTQAAETVGMRTQAAETVGMRTQATEDLDGRDGEGAAEGFRLENSCE